MITGLARASKVTTSMRSFHAKRHRHHLHSFRRGKALRPWQLRLHLVRLRQLVPVRLGLRLSNPATILPSRAHLPYYRFPAVRRCVVWEVRRLAPAHFGTCAVRDPRRSAPAHFGTCAVRDPRRLAPAQYGTCAVRHLRPYNHLGHCAERQKSGCLC